MAKYDGSQRPSHLKRPQLPYGYPERRNGSNFNPKDPSLAPTFSSSTSSLLTTYHPTLNPKMLESVTQMEPAYGPGSYEYELAADYIRSSTKTRIPTLWGTDIPNATVNSLKSVYPTQPNSLGKQSIIITNPDNTYRSRSTTFIPYIVNHDESHYYWGKDANENDETALIYKEETDIPKGALLFLFGFLMFPFWWVGAVYPRNPRTKLQQRWRIYNRMASVCSLPLMGFIVGLLVWNIDKYRRPAY
ncbi:hypothetical protein K493DRAFT_300150 [Basidiobolus meristosporus CBS 931.73]|uniref:Uncharacterized protein n=1 Tax=Basidiobolus meristosporus CBS 931.73 TaxID=1314790 RepID=A0A1Y1YIY1_9FUNG|nr:hypothetical protein K493DRAFT_300150 [Basidiobolus meristosporus CBS 931.73]|eukprot:ORX97987.1 hypothetical protein K493DRAFT_300150 [Basidiobolus meristosporus CBS 931.73]